MNRDKKMRATWKIKGLVAVATQGMIPKSFTVRYTSDNIGKSLSIADEANGVMFEIPFDAIYKEICNT